VTVTVSYDPKRLPDGLNPDDLRLLRYDQTLEEWFALESSVNTSAQTITGTTNAFSGFAAGRMLNVSNEEIMEEQPKKVALDQNYPNPFNPSTVINYTLPEASEVKIEVFNMLGQRVALLLNELRQPGRHSVTFNSGNLSSGMYIYRLQTANFSQSRKMMLIK